MAPPEAAAGSVLDFKPTDPFAGFDPVELIGEAEVRTNDLAWKLSGKTREPERNPPGGAISLAKRLRDHWAAAGLVEGFEGPRSAKCLRLIRLEETLQ